MAFSLRTLILLITVGVIWLAALLSGSPLFLALVAQLTSLFIALTLALALLDPSPSRRAFWLGFFCVAGSNLALTSLPLGDISKASFHLQGSIADLIQGDVSTRPGNQEFVPVTNDNGSTSYLSVAQLAYQEERADLRGALAACLSFAWGCLAGAVCQFLVRKE